MQKTNKFKKWLWCPILLLVISGCSHSLYMQGSSLAEQGDYDRAIEKYYAEIKANPASADAWRELGIAYYKKGELIKAEDALKQANIIKPEPLAYLYIGLLSEKQNNIDAAIAAYSTALNLNPKGEIGGTLRQYLERMANLKLQAEIADAVKNEKEIDAQSIPSNTIAVVDFDGSSLPAETAPLASGLAEFTAIDLSKVSALRVVERQKIDALLGELKLAETGVSDPKIAPRVGRILGSRNVVTGNLVGIGKEELRLGGAVVNIAESSAVMTDPSEGKLKGIFKLQKEFVFKIIDNLKIDLTQEERDAIQKVPTESYLAFMAYCRGLGYARRGMYKQAAQEFQSAVKMDRGFQQAQSRYQQASMAAKAGPGGELSFSQFEQSVENEAQGERGNRGLERRLRYVLNNSGALRSSLVDRASQIPPQVDNYGRVVMGGNLDAK